MTDILQSVVGIEVPRWAVMWGVAGVMFVGAKVATVVWARREGVAVSVGRMASFVCLWVGMDGRGFFREGGGGARIEWTPGLLKMVIGVVLLWGVAPMLFDVAPRLGGLAAGWVGMVGMVLMLHFGLFHLLAVFWRARGVCVEPIMNRPLQAKSLAEFWGERWNRAFNELMFRFVFRAAVRWAGPAGAMLMVFLVSGLIHDLVISVPAGGGYGGPTIYFVIQGMGMLLQRTSAARRNGWNGGMKGRFVTATVLIAPLPLLFHAPFINEVILPFMEVIGAGARTVGGPL